MFGLTQLRSVSLTTTHRKPPFNTRDLFVEYLVVAGGGGGGGLAGGGGGAGGYRTASVFLVKGGLANTVTIGAGGSAGVGDSSPAQVGTAGVSSVFSSITASGGGGGSSYNSSPTTGGSGGGGGGDGAGIVAGAAGNTPSTSPSQGNNGGNGDFTVNNRISGGGGVATAVGVNGLSATPLNLHPFY